MVCKDSEISSLREGLIETDTARMQVTDAFANKQEEWQKWRQSHAFSLLKLNDPGARFPYYAVRCKRINMNQRIKAIRKNHPRAVVIFQHRKVPNGINLFNRLRVEKLILSHINYCIPHNNESSLIAALNELCGGDYPAETNFPINVYAEAIPEPTIKSPVSPMDLFSQVSSTNATAGSTPDHQIFFSSVITCSFIGSTTCRK
jgi:hypothetical protein